MTFPNESHATGFIEIFVLDAITAAEIVSLVPKP